MEYVKEILAHDDRQCIKVYQAYNSYIAKEAVQLQAFGENFNINCMTWIKLSFLWLMYPLWPRLRKSSADFTRLRKLYKGTVGKSFSWG